MQIRKKKVGTPLTRFFLATDHTAIVVGDTATGLRFRRDTLGFTVTSRSENFGIEQERLKTVIGTRYIARLRYRCSLE